MFRTAITEMYGVEHPIICGAMMWIAKPPLCAAISNAGGMGNLTAANFETEDEFRDAIRQTRELTNRPFMVNVTILPSVRITGEHHQMYLRVCAEEKVDGIENSCAQIRLADPHHGTANDGIIDAEHFRNFGLDHGSPLH